jgi:hypothetical protein
MLCQIALRLTSNALSESWANPTDVTVAALMINLRAAWPMKAEMLAQLIADAHMMAVAT